MKSFEELSPSLAGFKARARTCFPHVVDTKTLACFATGLATAADHACVRVCARACAQGRLVRPPPSNFDTFSCVTMVTQLVTPLIRLL